MKKRKTLNDLTIKDNFMFAAVMLNPDICKCVIELALGFPVGKVIPNTEKSIVYNPKYRGVRLDVYTKDDSNRHFDVEMQVADTEVIKRARYYHSQIDMEILESGKEYSLLPDTYVIFICDFDPIGQKKYRYTMKNIFTECPSQPCDDGQETVFLSTKGENPNDVPQKLISFLKYVSASREKSDQSTDDSFISLCQEKVRQIRSSREMGGQYMLLEELLKDEYAEGKAEGLAEGKAEGLAEGKAEGLTEGLINSVTMLLSSKGDVPSELSNKINSVSDIDRLSALFKLAMNSSSVDEFSVAAFGKNIK